MPSGIATNSKISASDQGSGRKRRNRPVDQERQQQNEREIAEIAFAEHDVFERAEIAQAGAAVIEDFLAAFERAPDIAGQKLLQNQRGRNRRRTAHRRRRRTAVHRRGSWRRRWQMTATARPIRTNGRIVRRGLKRTSVTISANAAASTSAPLANCSHHTVHGGVSCMASVSGLMAMPTMRRPASAGSMVRQPSPRHREKCSSGAFPHHLAAPAQLAADHRRRQADHLEPRHGEMPAMQPHPEAPVALGALHVASPVPVVTGLVDEAEPQPHRIGKIEPVTERDKSDLWKMPSAEKAKARSGNPPLCQQPATFGSQRCAGGYCASNSCASWR